jgi:hypothetical protein
LAREATRDDIHHATPRLAVEDGDIVPHGEGFEASIVLSGHEDAASIVVDFDGADCPPTKEFSAEYATSSACE